MLLSMEEVMLLGQWVSSHFELAPLLSATFFIISFCLQCIDSMGHPINFAMDPSESQGCFNAKKIGG